MTAFPLPTWILPTSETLGEFMIHFLWLGGVPWCLGWLARSAVRGSSKVRSLLFATTMTRRPDEYPRCLMDLSHAAGPPCVLASSFAQKPLTVRVRRILTLQEPSMFRPRTRDLLSVSLCCVVCGVCLVDLTVRAEPPRPIAARTVEAPQVTPPPAVIVAAPVPQAQPSPPSQSRGPQSAKELVALQPIKRNWGPEQVIGAPDTAEAGDQVTAWASLSPDDAEEWLVCEYEQPVSLKSVRVHETYNPGALVKVTVFDPAGVEQLAWEGEDPTPRDQPKGISVIPVKLDFPVRKVKLYLDSAAVPGWNEIDAVGLEDEEEQVHWAKNVLASTTYAEPNGTATPGGKRSWGPEQAAGAPDTMDAGDFVTAWASLGQDDRPEWLICEYENPLEPAEIVVHENYNPGAVVKITAFDLDGQEHLAWEGVDPTPRDQPRGVSVFPVKLGFKTRKIKVDIDSPAVPGWNEIDAIGLRDADGATSWAVNVEASSTYAVRSSPVPEPVVEPVSTGMVTVPAEELMKFQQQIEELTKQVAELKQMQQDVREIKELLQKRRNKPRKLPQ